MRDGKFRLRIVVLFFVPPNCMQLSFLDVILGHTFHGQDHGDEGASHVQNIQNNRGRGCPGDFMSDDHSYRLIDYLFYCKRQICLHSCQKWALEDT